MLGRRKSLFVGTTLQMISDIYLGVYVKSRQQGHVSDGASKGAIAFIFIHGFGYATGTYTNPHRTHGTHAFRLVYPSICVWSRALAEPHTIVWKRTVSVFPLAVHIRHGLWFAVSSGSDSQLGRFSVLRRMVLGFGDICLLYGA